MNAEKDYSVGRMAEFNDRALEQSYYGETSHTSLKYTRYAALIIAFGFACLFFYDLQFCHGSPVPNAFFRMLPFLYSLFFFIRLRKEANAGLVNKLITGFTVITFLCYAVILYLGGEQDAFNVSISVSMFMLGSFVLPVRWLSLISMLAFYLFTFLLYVLIFMPNASAESIVQAFIFLLSLSAFIGVASYRTNKNTRKLYASALQLAVLSVTDALTGTYNRLKFTNSLHEWVGLCSRYDQQFSVMIFDVDDFKRINDSCGHAAGDEVLVAIAESVKKSIRKEDIFARWGGEEFICLLPYTSLEKAVEVADRLRSSIESSSTRVISEYTCSFGVTASSRDDTKESIIERADRLMYKSKSNGKNRVSYE